MGDNGSAQASADARPSGGHTSPGSRLTTADNWALKLGQEHGAQERAAARTSEATRQAAMNAADAAFTRWPRVVDAMTRFVAAYNQGAGRKAIDISSGGIDSGGPTVILRGGPDDAPRLTVTLEGSAIYARHSGSGSASGELEYHLDSDRSDDATAAYVLQRWMAQLQASRLRTL